MQKGIVIIIILMAANLLLSDTLMGHVSDSETEKPVIAVSVYIKGSSNGTVTDEDGKFNLMNLDPGRYIVFFNRLDYKTLEQEIDFPEERILYIQLEKKPTEIDGMNVSSTVAVDRETPVTFSNMNEKMIDEANFGQDIPMLMNELPNVFSYADAGSPIGYSNMKIRGFDQKRIGVMINGIPLNDPEDHNVYWVNMPDFAESVSDIQFQRGVGSSIYGVSTFGGSLNMQTNTTKANTGSEIFTNYGSYSTMKYGLKTTQNIKDYFKLNLRLSRITSDGYRDNSATEQWAYFAGLSRTGDRSVTELNLYGGKEITHAAWYASCEDSLAINHKHNPISYDNEIDDFSQPHLELHHRFMINENMNAKNSLFYIKGAGYYEQYKEGRNLWDFGLIAEDDGSEADLIRQKKVEKNQYGWVGNLDFNHDLGKLTFGSYISLFDSEHWGEIKEVIDASTQGIDYSKGQEYYNYTGEKQYLTVYVNELFTPIQNLSLMANLYYQFINFQFQQNAAGNFTGEYLNCYEVDYGFFNPRFGINYNLNELANFYSNLAFAHREPTDSELFDTWDGPDDLGVAPLFAESEVIYKDGEVDHIKWSDPYVKEEKLMDIEFGFGYDTGSWKVKTNLFWMGFEDEIIGYGGVDDDGSPIRGNADATVHQGVELEAEAEILPHLNLSGSLSYNDNYFEKFVFFEEQWIEDENGDWYSEAVEIDFSGNKIGGFPEILANTKLAYRWNNLFTSVQVQHVGQQYLDNTENDERVVEAYQLVNLGLSYEFVNLFDLTDVALNMKINNLLDKKYETSGYYDAWGGWYGPPGNYLFPGAGRNIIAGVRVSF